MLQDQYTEGTRDEAGKLVTPAIVYAKNPDGSPRFKLDDHGEPTTEREIMQGSIQLTNAVEHGRALRELNKQSQEIRVPHLSWIALEGKVPSLEANIVEALREYFDDVPTDDAAGSAPAGEGSDLAPATAARQRSTGRHRAG